MANFNLTITNEGNAFLANIIATQGSVEFTEMRFSTTNYVGQEATLTEGAWTGTFITAAPSASVVDSTTINVAASFDNTTLTAPKDLYSIGLIGDDGNNTALVAVATTSDPAKISEFILSPSYYAYNFNLGVSSTSGITVTGSMAGALFVSDIVDNLTSSNTNKPLSAKQGKVLEDGKADKVTSATSGDFAGLDSSGNLTDSGKKAADFATDDEMSAVVNVYSAKNIMPPIPSGSNDNVTYATDADGVVTVNGTPSGAYSYRGVEITNNVKAGQTYKLTGGHSAGKYIVVTAYLADGTWYADLGEDTGEGFTFTPTFSGYQRINVSIIILNGQTCTNEVFYPMIVDARITDSTYVPYAKTNRELTALTSAQNYTGYVVNTAIGGTDVICFIIGDLVVMYGTAKVYATGINQILITDLPKPKINPSFSINYPYPFVTWSDHELSYGGNIYIDSNGRLRVNNVSQPNAVFGFNLTYIKA